MKNALNHPWSLESYICRKIYNAKSFLSHQEMLSFLAPVVTWIMVDRRREPRYFMHSQAVTNGWELRARGAGGARAGGLGGCGPGAGFSPDIMGMTAGYIHEKEEEENGTKRIHNCLIPAYQLHIPGNLTSLIVNRKILISQWKWPRYKIKQKCKHKDKNQIIMFFFLSLWHIHVHWCCCACISI